MWGLPHGPSESWGTAGGTPHLCIDGRQQQVLLAHGCGVSQAKKELSVLCHTPLARAACADGGLLRHSCTHWSVTHPVLAQGGKRPWFILCTKHLLSETAPLGWVQTVPVSLSYLETSSPWGGWWSPPFSPGCAITVPWGSLFNLLCPAQGQPHPRW